MNTSGQDVFHLPTPAPTEYVDSDTPVSYSAPARDHVQNVDGSSPESLSVPSIQITHATESSPPSPKSGSDSRDRELDVAPSAEETVCCWGYFDCGEDGTHQHNDQSAHQPMNGTSVIPSDRRTANEQSPSGHFNTSDMRSTSS